MNDRFYRADMKNKNSSTFEKSLEFLKYYVSHHDSLSVFMNQGIGIRKSPEEIGNAFKILLDRMKKQINE
jgi:hypothetical protein